MTIPLAQVSDLIRRESGILVGPAQHGALELAIARVEKGMTPGRVLAMAGSTDILQRLIDEVTVRETFFFRHRSELDAIDWHGALRAARTRRSDVVRVWVAGCASGEEAYTVAALACEAYGSDAPPVRIVATDIALPALEQARLGRYRSRATRLLPEPIRERYFCNDGGRAEVGPSLRALVELVWHNLVRASAPPRGYPEFDVILCRNVLIYFDQPTVARVLALLERSLAPTGMLVLGAADLLSRQPTRRGTAPRGTAEGRRVARRVPATSVPVTSLPATSGPVAFAPALATAARATLPAPGRRISDAMQAADRGDLAVALKITSAALAQDPLSADAHYVRGIAELANGDARAAIASLRRALYVDPGFIVAAFKLARAHDDVGEAQAARSAYRRTLRAIDQAGSVPHTLLEQADVGDLVLACQARLRAIA